MSKPTALKPDKPGFFERTISKRLAAAILITTVIVAVALLATPRILQLFTSEPSAQFKIISQNDSWTKEEIPDGIGGDYILHVNATVENFGDAAGVCLLNVKVEEPDGRFWYRFRFLSISPGETVEEQVDFLEVLDKNVEYAVWLSYP